MVRFGRRPAEAEPLMQVDATKVAIFVVNPEGRAPLVHERKNERLSLPKGGIQQGESHDEAVRREYSEETGLDPDQLVIAGYAGTFIRHYVGLGEDHVMSYYIGTTPETGPLDPQAEDILSAHWVRLDSVRDVIRNPRDKVFIEDSLATMYELAGDLSGIDGSAKDAEA